MNRFATMIAVLALCLLAGCTDSSTPTRGPARATVTDLSVPFAASEADALVPRGFLGQSSFGRLDIGCSVEVIKTTDRAAQVKLLSCPPSQNTPVPVPTATVGWVAKSALDIKP